jgi:hypothetical protein
MPIDNFQDHNTKRDTINRLTHSLTHRPEPFVRSYQFGSHSRTSKFLWIPKVHYRVHKSPPLVAILSHIDSTHTIPSYFSKIHFNIVHPPTSCSSSDLFPYGFSTNILYAFLFSPLRATCPAYLILLGLNLKSSVLVNPISAPSCYVTL